MNKKLIISFMTLLSTAAFAQEKLQIKVYQCENACAKITEAIGTSIVIKGTTSGTMSDVNGDAILSLSNKILSTDKVSITMVDKVSLLKSIDEIRKNKIIVLPETLQSEEKFESQVFIDSTKNSVKIAQKIEAAMNNGSFKYDSSLSGTDCTKAESDVEKLFCTRTKAIEQFKKLMNKISSKF